MNAARPKDHAERLFWIELGFRIALAREAKGQTQGTLARRVGLSRTSICNLESGRQRTGLWELSRVAAALGVNLKRLIPKTAPNGKPQP